MDELFSFVFAVVNSFMLAYYYKDFLAPRACGLSARAVLTGFGAAYFIVQYAVHFLISLASDGVYDPILNIAISFSFLAVHMAALYCLTLVFFKKYTGMSVFLLCSFFGVQEICFRIALGLVTLPFLRDARTAAGIIQIAIYAALNLFFLKSISKSFLYKSRTFALTELLYLILPCVFGLAFVSLISVMPYGTDTGGNLKLYAWIPLAGLLIPLAGFIFLISLVAVVKLFQKLAELNIEEREKLVLRKQTVYMREQIKDIDSIYGEIKGMRHDMKNHLYNIKILTESILAGNTGDGKELEKYLGSFEETLNKLEFAF